MFALAAAVFAASIALIPVSFSAPQPAASAPRGSNAAQQEPETPLPARIHGRFIDAVGAPVAGVGLRLRGWPRRALGPAVPGASLPWQDPAPTLGRSDGRFELTFVPPETHSFTLHATCAGFASLGWTWSRLLPGEEVDLGELVLPRAATVVGYIVDVDGGLVIDGWMAAAEPVRLDDAVTRLAFVRKHVLVDPETGSFRIDDLPPGVFRVSGWRGTSRTNSVRVTAVAGSATEVELFYAGPEESTQLQIALQTIGPTSAGPAVGTVWAIGPDGRRVALQRSTEESRRWSVRAPRSGAHRIVVEDPAFLPAEVDGVMPGAPRTLALTGSVAVVLTVVDPATGAELTDFGLAIRYRARDEVHAQFALFAPGARVAGPHEPITLVPGDIELIVWANDRPKVLVPLGALPAGHTRQVRVELGPGVTLLGRVVDTTGAPVPGAVVELTQGELHGHDLQSEASIVQTSNCNGETSMLEIPPRDHRLIADEAGAFRVAGVAVGQWAAFAHHGPFVRGTTILDVRSETQRATEVELVLPAFTLADIALTGLGGADPQRYLVAVEGLGPPTSPCHPPAHRTHGLRQRATSDGRLSQVRVPLGRQRISVYEERRVKGRRPSERVWESIEDVTPALQLTLDLRRDD